MPHEHVNRAVGQRIRQRRRELEITLTKLAELCGVTFQQVQKYEQGASLSAARLWAVARALGVPVSFFFEGLAPPSPAAPGGGKAEDPGAAPSAGDPPRRARRNRG